MNESVRRLATAACVSLLFAGANAVSTRADDECIKLQATLKQDYPVVVPDAEEAKKGHFFFRDAPNDLAPNWASIWCPDDLGRRRSLTTWHPAGEAPPDFIAMTSRAASKFYGVPIVDATAKIKKCLKLAKADAHGNATEKVGRVSFLCGYGTSSESNVIFDPG